MNLFGFLPGYGTYVYDSGREPAFLVLLAFILTLAGTRFYTRMARVRGWGSAIVGDVHVHHLVPGVVLSRLPGHRDPAERKLKLELFGIIFSPLSLVGSLRLAKPTSVWAGSFTRRKGGG